MQPLALRPDDAAAALGISKSLLDEWVKAGKIRRPVEVPGYRIRLFPVERLYEDFQKIIEDAENGSSNPCDELLNL